MTKNNLSSNQLGHTKTNAKARELFNNLGGSGTAKINGFIEEEYNSKLSDKNGLAIYEQMRSSDAQINAILMMLELPIRSARWFISPAQNEEGISEDRDLEIASFIEENLWNMDTTFDDFLRQALTMMAFGFSLFELHLERREDRIMLKDLAFRKQSSVEKWEMEDKNLGITQVLETKKEESEGGENIGDTRVSIPAYKLLLFSNRREGDNYAGRSVLRSAYKHWYIKDRLYKLDAVKHERMALGIPTLTLPDGAKEEDKDEAEKIVQNIRSTDKSYIILPSSEWKFEFSQPKESEGTNIFESIKHHNREIAKNILAQFMELGDTSSGSRSLSSDHSNIFMQSEKAIAYYISDVINRYLIPKLVYLNFPDVERCPKIRYSTIGGDETSKTSILKDMVQTGIITHDDELESHIRDILELPPKAVDEEEDDKPEKKANSPKSKNDKEIEDKEDDDKEESQFSELNSLINNKLIIQLQNEITSASDKEYIKKKGFRFNEFENEAPRPLTFAERKVNLKHLSKVIRDSEQEISREIERIFKGQKDDLIKQIKEAVDNNDLDALENASIQNKEELSQILTNKQKDLFDEGKKSSAQELGDKIPPTKKEVKGALRVQNSKIVESVSNQLETSAISAVSQQIATLGGEISALEAGVAGLAVSEVIEKKIKQRIPEITTLVVSGAINMGRASMFKRNMDKVYGFQYSAILDENTTNTCLSLDGRVVKPNSKEYDRYSPPRHHGCRSIWVAILKEEEFKPEFTSIPSSIPANRSIETHVNMLAPSVLKNSPAMKTVLGELRDRQEKLKELVNSNKFPNRQAQHKQAIQRLEKAVEGKFTEFIKSVLQADGVKFIS